MRSAILIRSYWKDLEWLEWSLRSIGRYCTGFAEVVVVVPQSSRPWLARSSLPTNIRVEFCSDYQDDYLGQQVTKLLADTLLDSDFIVHVDSDCIFNRLTRPTDLVLDRRPLVLMRRSAEFGRHYPWRQCTEEFLGFEVEHDFMQRPPFVFPRWLYPLLRRHCLETHGVSIGEYVLSRAPRGFSEFNALGAYAWRCCRERFDFRDAGAPELPPSCCDWLWSWGGLTPAVRATITARLAPESPSGAEI